MLVFGLIGSVVSVPLWAMNKINDRQMIGITLILSWMALWYTAILTIYEAKRQNNAD
jgi:hypothetical protein